MNVKKNKTVAAASQTIPWNSKSPYYVFDAGRTIGNIEASQASVIHKFDGMRDLAQSVPEGKEKTTLLSKLDSFIGEWKKQTEELCTGFRNLVQQGCGHEA